MLGRPDLRGTRAPGVRRSPLGFAVLVGVALLLVLAAPAGAQYEPGQPGFVLDPPVTEPGTPVQVIGTGCPAGSLVEIAIDGRPVGTTTALDDGMGTFSAVVDAPPQSGQYPVTVVCGGITMQQILTVVASECGFAVAGSPGSPVTATAPGLALGTAYTLIFEHTDGTTVQVGSGNTTADPQTVNFTIPSNATAGRHQLLIAGTSAAGGDAVVTCEVTVATGSTAGAGAPTAGSLPRTGSGSTTTLLQVAVALVGLGGLVLVAGRRRAVAS